MRLDEYVSHFGFEKFIVKNKFGLHRDGTDSIQSLFIY